MCWPSAAHARIRNKENLPGIARGTDTTKNLSWLAVGYDPVAESYPITQQFPNALSVANRAIAEDCHRNLQQLSTLRVIQESMTAKQALPNPDL